MLLTRLTSRLRSDERGVALAAVVALMATGLLLTTLVAGSVINSVGFTSATRASVQSEAAAEAGIAAARAGLISGTCSVNSNRYASAAGATPSYVATIWVPSGSSWVRGCPVGTATQVRILSTGYATATGVNGASGGNKVNMEVILNAAASSSGISASGPAIYAYNASGFGGGGLLYSVNGSNAAIMVKTGDLLCDGGAEGATSLVVDSGNLTVAAGCEIAGNVWASGRVSVPGGPNVGGNVVGAGVTISGGSAVGGSVWSSLDLTMTGNPTVGGNVTAASMNIQGTVAGSAWVYGNSTMNWGTVFKGNITTRTLTVPNGSNFIAGTKTITNPNTPGPSPYVTPPRPIVPGWVDFGYDKTKWSGFTEVVLTAANCSFTALQVKVTALGSQPGLIDARACAQIQIDGSNKLAVGGDLAIIANKFVMNGGGGFTATSAKRLWLINPDATADGLPTCAANQSFLLDGGFTFSTNLSVMMYSPCQINIQSSTAFRGQIFAGKADVDGGSSIGFVAVGLPGVDLSTGGSSTVTGGESTRTVASIRNVTVGN